MVHYWIDLNQPPQGTQTIVNGTPAYIEVQTHTDQPDWKQVSYVYVLPLDNSNFVAAACWGHQFDQMAQYFFDPKMGNDWVNAYSEAWPSFGELLRNAAGGRYGAGGLVNLEDPDDGERKWFVVTFVGNTIPKDSYDEVLDDSRVEQGVQLVYVKSAELLEQMGSETHISTATKLKMFGKGAWGGYKEGLDKSLVLMNRFQQIAQFQTQ
jgi:hypothetical protein